MGSVWDPDVVRDVVVVRVGVEEEAALLDDELPGTDARTIAAVPAERAPRHRGGERGHGHPHVVALLILAEPEYLLPAVPMADDVVPPGGYGAGELGVGRHPPVPA